MIEPADRRRIRDLRGSGSAPPDGGFLVQATTPDPVPGDLEVSTSVSDTGAPGAGVPAPTAPSAPFAGAPPQAPSPSPAGFGAPAANRDPVQQATWADWAYYIKGGLRSGRDAGDLLREMQFRGCHAQASYALMHDVVKTMSNEAKKEILLGGAALLLGVGITLFTFEMASGGGTYFIFWAPAAVGVWYLLRGAWKWSKLPRI
jgi:hypothetical protein